jgi:dolichol-phosphate mannosyltransferase
MILLVLPAFNEEKALGPLFAGIRQVMEEAHLDYEVVVVDDGSTDETAQVVAAMRGCLPIVSVKHDLNRGLAEALRSGLTTAVDRAGPEDIVVTMDADNTHAPGLVVRMINLIREGHDVVVASRFSRGARVIGVPAHRRLLSFGASVLLKLFFPITNVRDYTCGYRAYRASCLRAAFAQYSAAFIEQRGFSCMVDVLLKLRAMRLIMTEVPLILRYDRKHGMSKMRAAQTVLETLGLVWRNLISH